MVERLSRCWRGTGEWISERRTNAQRRLDRLGEYLAETAGSPGTAAASPASASGQAARWRHQPKEDN